MPAAAEHWLPASEARALDRLRAGIVDEPDAQRLAEQQRRHAARMAKKAARPRPRPAVLDWRDQPLLPDELQAILDERHDRERVA